MDSQDWKLCLNRQEVKDLGNGLLIGAISKHNAVETIARQKLTHLGAQLNKLKHQSVADSTFTCVTLVPRCTAHLCNHRLWVCLVHFQRHHVNIKRVLGAPG